MRRYLYLYSVIAALALPAIGYAQENKEQYNASCVENGEAGNWEEAYYHCKQATNYNDPAAKYYYAKSISATSRSENRQMVEEALRLAMRAHDMGYKAAMPLVGELYQKGAFPNYDRSLNAYKQAYEEGNAESAVDVAMLYYDAKKLNDVAKAKEWFTIAADNDIPAGRYGLGLTLFEENDHEGAAKQFMLAAKAGYPQAMIATSRFYHNGLVYKRDEIEAIRWMKKAIEAGREDMRVDLTKLLSGLNDSERLRLLRDHDQKSQKNDAPSAVN